MIKYVNGIEVTLTDAEITEINSTYTAEYSYNFNMQIFRAKRNALLSKTDWTANSDLTMSSAMTTYRQALRDAPTGLDTVEKVEAYEFPEEVTS
tara:strand:- start:118 stop:399 length:282 start_codon:yes stop_codon:yes gene_type:complete